MKTKPIIFVVPAMFLFCAIALRAHSIGTTEQGHSQRLWTNTATGKTVVASFLLANKDEVFLEDAVGGVIAIPLSPFPRRQSAYIQIHANKITVSIIV